MAGEVFRIINFGGERTESVRGGRGVEYFAVVGLGPDEMEAAHTTGLPRIGEFHLNPSLGFLGTVQEVSQVREFPPTLWIARVIYSTGGTFYFTTRLGSSFSSDVDRVRLPLVQNGANYGIDASDAYIGRRQFMIRYSNRAGIPEATIRRIAIENADKVYLIDGIKYQFAGVDVVTDAGNNTRVDTSFVYRAPIGAIAANTYGTHMAIPALPANCEWSENISGTSTTPITVIDPSQVYGNGATLPWLL